MKKKTLFRRFTRLVKITLRGMLLRFEDPIKVMAYKLDESKETIKELEERVIEMKVKYNLLAKEIEAEENTVDGYERALKIALAENDEKKGADIILMLDKAKARLASKKAQEETMSEMLTTLRNKLETLRTKFTAAKAEYEALKSEHEFAQSMGKINKELRDTYSEDVDLSEMEEIKQKVKTNVSYQKELTSVLSEGEEQISEIEKARQTFKKMQEGQE